LEQKRLPSELACPQRAHNGIGPTSRRGSGAAPRGWLGAPPGAVGGDASKP